MILRLSHLRSLSLRRCLRTGPRRALPSTGVLTRTRLRCACVARRQNVTYHTSWRLKEDGSPAEPVPITREARGPTAPTCALRFAATFPLELTR